MTLSMFFKIFIFLYFIFLLILIKILSTSDYEWMIEDKSIESLCQLPLGGRYITEPILVIAPCIIFLFLEKKKSVRYTYISITITYITWSFFLRFNWC